MTEQVAAEKLGADKQKLANAAKLALETLVNKAAAEGLPAIPKFRPRELLAKDLTAKDNLLFARSSVNRIWFLLMGRGLFHPLDQMHGKNPPAQPELLDELVRDFIAIPDERPIDSALAETQEWKSCRSTREAKGV